ncbi:MAG: trypsin-like peptidase domain-containing protein [Rubricoccaceae bacterium]
MRADTKRRISVGLLVVAAFMGGVFFVTSAASLSGLSALLPSSNAQAVSTPDAAIASAQDLGRAFTTVAERVNPAVVQISAARTVAQRRQGGSAPADPFEGTPFEGFFRMPEGGGMAPPVRQGLGSGAFVRADGYIVTNNHVIEGADDITVTLFDGRRLPATVVGTDAFSDLAVLRVEGNDFPYLRFGDAASLRVGEWVLAFGSPLSPDLSNTVTSGIVSGLGRRQGGGISNYIQTDAAVNPGNSGGPLVNLRGEIVGINSAIATRTGGFQGISFAIPVDIVQNTVEQLIASGTVERGYLGIAFTPISPALARSLGAPVSGAVVNEIQEDAQGRRPAAEAGVRVDDVITAIDGVPLQDPGAIISAISNRRPGDTVELTLNRGGREQTARVRLGTRPDPDRLASSATRPNGRGNRATPQGQPASAEMMGMTLQNLSQTARQRFGVAADVEGVIVTEVDPRSEAAREANIAPGMVIVEANRQPVRSLRDFEQAVASVQTGQTFLVRVRQGNATFLTALTKSS